MDFAITISRHLQPMMMTASNVVGAAKGISGQCSTGRTLLCFLMALTNCLLLVGAVFLLLISFSSSFSAHLYRLMSEKVGQATPRGEVKEGAH
ncbi:hypothetical protein TYRP_014289 [Tyrophagus putrescentiae]|nr:hypothetical protein TYRP_014289 [Tyrophagus putrescentiae]